MYKEFIISIIIMMSIFGLNYIMQKNLDESVNTMKNYLEEVKSNLVKEDTDYSVALEKVNRTYDKWEEIDDQMAFYIEHDELEKVKTAITSMKSFVQMEDNSQAVDSLDRCMYILDHIDEREKVTLDNIF